MRFLPFPSILLPISLDSFSFTRQEIILTKYNSAKLTSSIRTLTPNLQSCDRSVSAMKAALSEMVMISNILTCHDDGRDGEGIRREENDVLEGEGGEGGT